MRLRAPLLGVLLFGALAEEVCEEGSGKVCGEKASETTSVPFQRRKRRRGTADAAVDAAAGAGEVDASLLLSPSARLWGGKPPAAPELTSSVGFSALCCAAARAKETLSPLNDLNGYRLVVDPCALDMAGQQGFHMFDVMAKGGYTRNIELRTKIFDDFVYECTTEDVEIGGKMSKRKQVVLPAAGMDARAFRMNDMPSDVTFFEIDNEDVINWKEEGLNLCADRYPEHPEYTTPNVALKRIKANLKEDDWSASLKEAGYDPTQPSCWIVEGLSMYIKPAGLDTLMTTIQTLTASGSSIAGDSIHPRMYSFAGANIVNDTLKLFNSPIVGDGIADPEAWLQEYGWTEAAESWTWGEMDEWGIFTDQWKKHNLEEPLGHMFFGNK